MADSALAKRDNESDFEYHKRIVKGKLVDKTLSDYDYSELSKYVYGKDYSADVARRMFYGSRRTIDLLESENTSNIQDEDLLSELDQKMVDLKIERQKFLDQRTAFNKVVRERSRQEELNEILADAVKNGNLPELCATNSYVDPSDNTLLISLNDIHYGIVVDNAWTKYDPCTCNGMMRHYLDRIISIAETHGSENCIVYNNGDSISGKIHSTIQIANKENVVKQVTGVSELIAEFLAELSSHFNLVEYVGVSGNHSRLDTKEKSPIDERLDDLIEWYLQARLQNFENIHIATECRIDPTMYVIDVRGKTYVGVHGDFDCSAQKIAALQAMVGKPIYAVLLGHLHHNKIDSVQGIKTVMSGAFVGVDDYCVSKRIYSKPEQIVCVCNDTGIVCYYDVQL